MIEFAPVPGHNHPLPTGREVAAELRRYFVRQKQEAVRDLNAGRPVNLDHWTSEMAERFLASGYFQELFRVGGEQALRQIARTVGAPKPGDKSLLRRGRFGGAHLALRTKDLLGAGFDVFQAAQVKEMIRRWIFDFCQETNDTATARLNDALRELKDAFAVSLEMGEIAQTKLAARVQELFDSPDRAQRIAMTESSRFLHGGGRIAAKESGVVARHEWLASADACSVCLKYARMGAIPLEKPYATGVSANPNYSTIWHPGAHPWCMCTEVFLP